MNCFAINKKKSCSHHSNVEKIVPNLIPASSPKEQRNDVQAVYLHHMQQGLSILQEAEVVVLM